jgi:hypothetical protein
LPARTFVWQRSEQGLRQPPSWAFQIPFHAWLIITGATV